MIFESFASNNFVRADVKHSCTVFEKRIKRDELAKYTTKTYTAIQGSLQHVVFQAGTGLNLIWLLLVFSSNTVCILPRSDAIATPPPCLLVLSSFLGKYLNKLRVYFWLHANSKKPTSSANGERAAHQFWNIYIELESWSLIYLLNNCYTTVHEKRA